MVNDSPALLGSLNSVSPVRDDMFIEIDPTQKNEPHRGDLL
jgi:hypothetical protein